MPKKPPKKPDLSIRKTAFQSFDSWLDTVFTGKSPVLNSYFVLLV
jgi:hypothetical protein